MSNSPAARNLRFLNRAAVIRERGAIRVRFLQPYYFRIFGRARNHIRDRLERLSALSRGFRVGRWDLPEAV